VSLIRVTGKSAFPSVKYLIYNKIRNVKIEKTCPNVENKRKEWIFLKEALKTKSVTPIK
jgi:hypothetical protein